MGKLEIHDREGCLLRTENEAIQELLEKPC